MAVPTTLHIGRPCMLRAPSRRRGLGGGGRLAAVPRVGRGGGWGGGWGGGAGGRGGRVAAPRRRWAAVGCTDPPPWGGVGVPARLVPPLAGPGGGGGGEGGPGGGRG